MIGGRVYPLNTDYRAGAWFQAAIAAGEKLTAADVFTMFFGDPRRDPGCRWPAETEEALEAIGRYLRRKDAPPEAADRKRSDSPQAFDFVTDADILLADFQRVYGLDLTTAELSWWRFMALLEGLYCYSFADRVSYRAGDLSGLTGKQKKDALKKRSLFAIRRGSGCETYKEHMARLEALASEAEAEAEQKDEVTTWQTEQLP